MNTPSHILSILIGPPGSGKGSIARKCATDYGWLQLSTGDLCRTHVAQGTEIGRQIDFLIKNGKLIDDSLMLDMVSDWLETSYKKSPVVILDGFPRTVSQAAALAELIRNRFLGIFQPVIIELDLTDAMATDRIVNRWVCENVDCGAIYPAPQAPSCLTCGSRLVRRADDTKLEIIRSRMAIYREHANALVSWYKQHGYVIEQLNAAKPMQAVFEDFCHMLQKRLI